MKNQIITLFLFVLGFECAAQQINIPYGISPVIDGIISSDEWTDADSVTINVQPFWDVKVLYKHNDSCLFFLFKGLVKTGYGERYPDVMLDIYNDKSTTWNPDDWWLHASYNDCECVGNYNDWTSCQPEHIGWTANNFPLSAPGIIEMEITYAKIGISNLSEDTIGISLEVSDTYNDYNYFPNGALIDNPSTWATGVFSAPNSISAYQKPENSIKVFPNPSSESVTLQFSNPKNEECKLLVFNEKGQIVEKIEDISTSEIELDIKSWQSGLYILSLENKNGAIAKGRIILQ